MNTKILRENIILAFRLTCPELKGKAIFWKEGGGFDLGASCGNIFF